MAYIFMTYIVMAYILMAYVLMDCRVMAYIVMAYTLQLVRLLDQLSRTTKVDQRYTIRISSDVGTLHISEKLRSQETHCHTFWIVFCDVQRVKPSSELGHGLYRYGLYKYGLK